MELLYLDSSDFNPEIKLKKVLSNWHFLMIHFSFNLSDFMTLKQKRIPEEKRIFYISKF